MIKIGGKIQQKKGPGSGLMKKSRKTFVHSRLYLRHLDNAWHIADVHGLNILECMAPQRFLQCCILGCHTYRDDCRWVHEISHFFLMKSLSGSTLTGIINLPWPRCRLNQKFLDMETDTGESLGIAGYSESPHSHLSTSSHFPRNWRGFTRFSSEARSRCVFNGEYCVVFLGPAAVHQGCYSNCRTLEGSLSLETSEEQLCTLIFLVHFRRINNRVSMAKNEKQQRRELAFFPLENEMADWLLLSYSLWIIESKNKSEVRRTVFLVSCDFYPQLTGLLNNGCFLIADSANICNRPPSTLPSTTLGSRENRESLF